MPSGLCFRVEQELEWLEKGSIIEQTQFLDWAASTVPVLKQDRTVRICEDYKVTVNHASSETGYSVPIITSSQTE